LIEREVSRGIPAGRIVLAGFSQGGAVTLYAVPRYPQKLAGAIALSCYLPTESVFATQKQPANDATPIFMAHGATDPVVPMTLGQHARDFLKGQGYPVEWHDYPMPHAVCPPEIAAIREYLMRVLP
jgi:phospholipase/carboxylesterase